jgi:hypothetical protein
MSNAKPFFTPEDFEHIGIHSFGEIPTILLAERANAKLEAALGPYVFFEQYADGGPERINEIGEEDDTHTARLFNVQPIQPVNKHTGSTLDSFNASAANEHLDTMNAVMSEVLLHLEASEQSPFADADELSAYIRLRLNIPKPPEPDTAENLLEQFVSAVKEMPLYSINPDHTEVFRIIAKRAQCLLDGVPTPAEVDAILRQGVDLKGTSRLIEVASQYSNGRSLQQIADGMNVTRERIRQMIAKFVRQNRSAE